MIAKRYAIMYRPFPIGPEEYEVEVVSGKDGKAGARRNELNRARENCRAGVYFLQVKPHTRWISRFVVTMGEVIAQLAAKLGKKRGK